MSKNSGEEIMDQLSALKSLIDTDNVESVKQRIGDLIVQRVEEDMREYNQYIFWPPDYEGVMNEAIDGVEKKIKKLYSDAMLEVAQKAVDVFKETALEGLKTIRRTEESK